MVGSELDMNPRPEDIEETLPREASGLPVALGPGGPILFVAFFCDNPRELPSRHSLARLESVAIGRGRDRTARRDAAQGLLELTLPDRSKLIVNTQPPLHEIWLAARRGGFHFRHQAGRWIDTKSGEEFWSLLSACASEQVGRPLRFAPAPQ